MTVESAAPLIPITTIEGIRRWLIRAKQRHGIIGLVPTMGALHAGHTALIDRARCESGCVVVSIFVNPIQFDRPEDFHAYTIRLDDDLRLCAEHGADAVFAPPVEEMYPTPPNTYVEVAGVADHLCGKFRPGHFRGVATVVMKLFHIVEPDRAYFGEKDTQQLAVIRKMAADMNLALEIVAVPTVREPDGLALSSRNRRLTAEQRRAAPVLFLALCAAKRRFAAGCQSADELREEAAHVLAGEPLARVEYLEVVDAATMMPIERVDGAARIAAAVWFGSTRLIDNVALDVS